MYEVNFHSAHCLPSHPLWPSLLLFLCFSLFLLSLISFLFLPTPLHSPPSLVPLVPLLLPSPCSPPLPSFQGGWGERSVAERRGWEAAGGEKHVVGDNQRPEADRGADGSDRHWAWDKGELQLNKKAVTVYMEYHEAFRSERNQRDRGLLLHWICLNEGCKWRQISEMVKSL